MLQTKRSRKRKSKTAGINKFFSSASTLVPDWLDQSAWREHAPFGFWIVGAHSPQTLVELGTHTGYSFFTFCQAIMQLGIPTRAYAIDTWKGDEHSGFYGEEVFQALSAYHAQHFGGFSQLIRSTFDEALAGFEDHSIDFLHIDGRHFYEDVKHDFGSWLPKLSDRAIVLFHDTNVRERNFGVFRLWTTLAQKFPHFEFFHGHGLGVLGIGTDLPDIVVDLFNATHNEGLATEIRNSYARLGSSLTDRYEKSLAEAALQVAHRRVLQLEGALQERAEELGRLSEKYSSQVAELQQSREELSSRIGELENAIKAREEEAKHLQDRLSSQLSELETVLQTRTAKIVHLQQELSSSRAQSAELVQKLTSSRYLFKATWKKIRNAPRDWSRKFR